VAHGRHAQRGVGIEPLRYREAQARFLTETEQVAMQAINLYFGLLLAGEQVNIARQNLQTAEKLYEVAQAKRRMGTISENDVLQLRLDVLTARSALTNSESTRQARQFALRSFLDVEAPIAATVPEASALGLHLDYEDVLAHALQNNALATTMRRRQMEADYAVASARANRQSINLYAQLGYTGTGDNMNSAYRNGQAQGAASPRREQPRHHPGPAAPAVAGLPPGHLYPDRAVQQPG